MVSPRQFRRSHVADLLAIAWPDTRNTVTVKQLSLKSSKGSDALKEKTG
jgi:hypothetical protein